MTSLDVAGWDALAHSSAAVRAGPDEFAQSPRRWRGLALRAAYLVVLGGVVVAAVHAVGTATPVRADGTADADLFALTNQDRASNGVRSVGNNGTLSVIGEGGRYNGCPGLAINGRSVDMIQRNYFAHPILGCGQYVFSIMHAYGIGYQSAGENIGWNVYADAASAAAAINVAFMNSPDHRSNILNGAYTDLGIGSFNSGAAAWTGGGGSYTGVWMFSEEFAQLGSAPPPPPPPPPPRATPRPGGSPPRNTPAPVAPAQPPVTAAGAATPAPGETPAATPSPTPSPTAAPTPLPDLTLPPLLDTSGGLLFDSVEMVLENFLIS